MTKTKSILEDIKTLLSKEREVYDYLAEREVGEVVEVPGWLFYELVSIVNRCYTGAKPILCVLKIA